jgi:hypothetical protein
MDRPLERLPPVSDTPPRLPSLRGVTESANDQLAYELGHRSRKRRDERRRRRAREWSSESESESDDEKRLLDV